MVSKNNAGKGDLTKKLNHLEDKVAKLTLQIKADKQTINELNLALAQRDAQICDLELKLGFAQQSLFEKVANKIQDCRSQIKTDIAENLILPSLTQIQHQLKSIQDVVAEATTVLREKKALFDNGILNAKDKAVQFPEQATSYIEHSFINPTQALMTQMANSLSMQAKTTKILIEDRAIYPGKVIYDEILALAISLPGKVVTEMEIKVLNPIRQNINQISQASETIYPTSLAALEKSADFVKDGYNQALAAIIDQIKNSPFWDGKNRLKTSF